MDITEVTFTENFTHIIDGKPVTSPTSTWVVNPATGEPLTEVPVATYAQLEQAVAAAEQAFISWSAKTPKERADVLHALAKLIERYSEAFTELIMREVGKDRQSAAFEVAMGLQGISAYASHSLEDEIVASEQGRTSKIRYRPYGVCAAAIAFNFPLIFCILKLTHALLAGNCLILKTAPTAPCVSLKLIELAQSVVPPGVLSVLYGGDELGQWLIQHPRIMRFSFTGSTATGKAVMREAAAGIKSLTLELGGNDPAIVLPDVHVKKVAQHLLIGAINNAGQQCFAMKRLFIHEDVYDAVRDEIVALAKQTKIGDPFAPETVMGPVQNKRVYEKLKGLIADCKTHGYKIAYDGEAGMDAKKGYFLPIVIVDNPPDDSRIVREEQFGPIIPLLKWKDEQEVVARANDTEYGLNASVWGSDVARIQKIADQLYVGSVWINEWAAMTGDLPFLGVKHSGLGVESSKYGLLSWVYPQAYVCRESLNGGQTEPAPEQPGHDVQRPS